MLPIPTVTTSMLKDTSPDDVHKNQTVPAGITNCGINCCPPPPPGHRSVTGLPRHLQSAGSHIQLNRQDELTDNNARFRPLNPELAVEGIDLKGVPVDKPRGNLKGEIYYLDNKYYIQQEGKVFQVYSDGGWTDGSIRIKVPGRTQGPLITCHQDKWCTSAVGLQGGGLIYSMFAKTPKQQAVMDILTTISLLPKVDRAFRERVRSELDTFSDEALEHMLRHAAKDLGVSTVEDFRSVTGSLSRGGHLRGISRGQLVKCINNMLNNLQTWSIVHALQSELLRQTQKAVLSVDNRERIHDLLKNSLKSHTDEEVLNMSVAFLPDILTGNKTIFFSKKGRKEELHDLAIKYEKIESDTINKTLHEYMNEERLMMVNQFSEENKISFNDAMNHFLITPGIKEQFEDLRDEKLREIYQEQNLRPLQEIKNKKFPYVILVAGGGVRAVDTQIIFPEDIDDFRKGLSRFTTPLIVDYSTRAKTNKVIKQDLPCDSEPAAGPSGQVRATRSYRINTSALASSQMAFANFPESARRKVTEVSEDITHGRVPMKNIRKSFYVDMPGLGSRGRGPWRAAYSLEQETYTLEGFYDYHGSKLKVWGGLS